MRPSDMLSDELDQIFSMLDILQVIYERLRDNQEVNLQDLKKVINFFRVFVHLSHNKKEENILFPEIEKSQDLNQKNIVQELRMENELTEFYMTLLKKLLLDIERGNLSAKEQMMKMMKKYHDLEKSHIQKEQIFVLPLCQQELSDTQKEDVVKQFKLSDEAKFGSGMHDKFHDAFSSIIHSMKEQYYSEN